jgi:hypothetical protein
VYYILKQNPSEFEFNERFLLKILENVKGCIFGDFLLNSEKELIEANLKKKLISMFTVLNFKELKKNLSYHRAKVYKSSKKMLKVDTTSEVLVYNFWYKYYFQYKFNFQSKINGLLEIENKVINTFYSKKLSYEKNEKEKLNADLKEKEKLITGLKEMEKLKNELKEKDDLIKKLKNENNDLKKKFNDLYFL